jgi:hypothetical protein
VEKIIRGPTSNHTLKKPKNWWDVQEQVGLHYLWLQEDIWLLHRHWS